MNPHFFVTRRSLAFIIGSFLLSLVSPRLASPQAQSAAIPSSTAAVKDADHVRERAAWFYRGRIVAGRTSAELRRRAYHSKMQMRAQRALRAATASATPSSSVGWIPLGPVPLASDASGSGVQDYHYVSGRATAVAIDPADPTGNTVYIGGAQAGVWKSINGANATASTVTWTPLTDNQPTLSVGSIAIQPGNTNPTKTVILVGTGEANNSADSYFGLGILRSVDAGNTWNLISTANGGALSFSGLGGTRMAFSNATTVVAAMGTTSEGSVDGAITTNTKRGLYTSLDAGQSWTYDALFDPGNQPTDATSATSVVYNAVAGSFFAAVRYHGIYSSTDGVHWARLGSQPGGSVLSTIACPALSSANAQACPIYRGEVTVVPGRNEMYVWYVSLDGSGNAVDRGIWQSLDGGSTWSTINDNGITNCGDPLGCGVEQGYYNLELLAVPNASSATDLYAGAVNVYKCSLSSINPGCNNSGFMNLTHAYGCVPIAAPAHVHPDQHALAFMIPISGSDSGNALMYFANDGGIYRALDGFSFGPGSGSCSSINAFDDLNQNLGSMTQFVSFSQHPSDPNTLLGGAQDNGSPATSSATSSTNWINVNGGDGGFNAIDPGSPLSWYVSNPDVPPGGLNIFQCSNGVSCREANFSVIADSNSLAGDDGGFYFPYVLDPQSQSALLVGTCRVWRGPRLGGAYADLSPNFDTLGSGTCTGSEVNLVRSLAAGGPTDADGSRIIYATTDGPGPLNAGFPTGGHVWVTTDATAGAAAFSEVSQDINPNQFPISAVAIDSSDASGATAYVTIMGFTGGAGHVWKTTNAGATWSDFSGTGAGALPDAPANTVVIDASASDIFVGTDVGVFHSSTAAPNWIELDPDTGSGFLPNAAVTALGIFSSGGQKLLRASTYGRGIWQWNLAPDFQVAISNSPQTVVLGKAATFNGTVTAINGYSDSIALMCVAGTTPPPSTCTPAPVVLTATVNTAFTVSAAGAIGDYSFNVQATGSDTNAVTHQVPVVLHVITNKADFVLTEPSAFPVVNAGSTTTGGSINIAVINGFSGTVNLSCSLVSGNGSCSVTPNAVSSFPATANVTVNAAKLTAGSYQLSVQGTSGSLSHSLAIPFNVADYQLSGTQALTIAPGGQAIASLSLSPSTFYVGSVNATCSATALAGASCTLNPSNPISLRNGSPVALTATVTAPPAAASGSYAIQLSTRDTSGAPAHNQTITVTVNPDFTVGVSPSSQTITAGQTSGSYQLNVQPVGASFNSPVTFSCSAGLPAGLQCNFNPSSVTPGSGTASVAMTISTTSATPTGSHLVTVTATSGSLSHSVAVTLVVTGSNSLQLAISQAFATNADAGSQVSAQVSLKSNYSASVTLNCDASAFSGQCSIAPANPVAVTPASAVTLRVTVNIPSSAAPNPSNTYTINIAAADAAGQTSQKISLPLTVIQDFSVSSATPSQTVTAGQKSGAYQLTIGPNPVGSAFHDSVTLSCPSGLPPGAQCIFNPSGALTFGGSGTTSQSVVLNITTAAASARTAFPLRPGSNLAALSLLFPGIVIAWGVAGATLRLKTVTWSVFMLLVLALTLAACGGGTGSGGGSPGGPQPGTPTIFSVTITGTSGSLSHSTAVQLVVQ